MYICVPRCVTVTVTVTENLLRYSSYRKAPSIWTVLSHVDQGQSSPPWHESELTPHRSGVKAESQIWFPCSSTANTGSIVERTDSSLSACGQGSARPHGIHSPPHEDHLSASGLPIKTTSVPVDFQLRPPQCQWTSN